QGGRRRGRPSAWRRARRSSGARKGWRDPRRACSLGDPRRAAGDGDAASARPGRRMTMRSTLAWVVSAAFGAAVVWPAGALAAADPSGPVEPGGAVGVRRAASVASLNGFVRNDGQWSDAVRFLARGGGVEAVVLQDAVLFHPLPRWPAVDSEQERRRDELLMRGDLAGAAALETFEPLQALPVPGPALTLRFDGARAV